MLHQMKLLASCFGLFAFVHSPSIAQTNDYNVIEVCNKGNVLLAYAVFATKTDYWMGDRAEASAWYQIKPGKCQNVNPGTYRGVSIGFYHEGRGGVIGNPVYVVSGADRPMSGRFEADTVCLPSNAKYYESGSLSSVRSKILPPCKEGYHEFQMSFYVQPNDVFSKITLKPDKHAQVAPWPGKSSVSPKIAGENRSVSILDGSCRNHYTLFDEDDLQKLCTCPSQAIVANHQDVVYLIEFSISNGDGFNEAIKVVNRNDLERYANVCLVAFAE